MGLPVQTVEEIHKKRRHESDSEDELPIFSCPSFFSFAISKLFQDALFR